MQNKDIHYMQRSALKKFRLAWFGLAALLAVGPPPARAAILTVGPGQTYATIQGAVNAAQAGDQIDVYAGTYMERVDLSWMAVPGSLTIRAASTPVVLRAIPPLMHHSGAFNHSLSVSGLVFQASSDVAPGLDLSYADGSILLSVANSTFSNCGVRVVSHSAATVTGTVSDCTFTNFSDEAIHFSASNAASLDVSVLRNSIRNGSGTWPAVHLLAGDSADLNVLVQSNSIANLANSDGIVVRSIPGARTLTGEIADNVVANVGTNVYDRGIFIDLPHAAAPGPEGFLRVAHNDVGGSGGSGLKIRVLNSTNRWQWCAMDMVVASNVVASANQAGGNEGGIDAEVGTALGNHGELWLDLHGNTAAQGIRLVHGDVSNSGKFVVPGNPAYLAQTNAIGADLHVQFYNPASIVATQGTLRVAGAKADAYTLREDTNVVCNVLSNDYDMRGERSILRIASITQPQYGTASIQAGSTNILYTPAPNVGATNYHPTDSFTYTATNGVDWTNTATVYLNLVQVYQAIDFPAISDKVATDAVGLFATATSGLPVTFAVTSGAASISGGTNLTFSGAGSVSIVASQAGNTNWLPAPRVTNTFNVTKAAATVFLANLEQVYDGTARTVTATTMPAGLTVEFTYDGGASAPTAVGSYAVTGTVASAMYQGFATGTLAVAKRMATVSLGSL
jgi:hypothetical protein